MGDHFRAFSFVDRIPVIRKGSRVEGSYAVPPAVPEFPLSLVGEAIGQLAAWAAMAAVDFSHRPVAGLAGGIELVADPLPDRTLALAAEIESVDTESVAYRGTACAGGRLLIRLEDCVGPMMRVVDFDDPAALRQRFHLLCGAGAVPGGFAGLPPLELEPTGGEIGRCARAVFRVPAGLPLFGDHFPHRPVFPGSLLMHLSLQLAADLARHVPPPPARRWRPGTIRDLKLRSFISPGQTLSLEARVKERSDSALALALETRSGSEIIATARLVLQPEGTRS
jgi:3-hydroxymyristoyl/3-hydroxydecanoyl-(acyl carrier protein) dehydratase